MRCLHNPRHTPTPDWLHDKASGDEEEMADFDEDPDEVLKEEDIRAVAGSRSREEIERIDFRETEEVNNIDLI